MNTYNGYIGTYTTGESKGIYSFSLDKLTGLISNINLAAEVANPTYLVADDKTNKLYSVLKSTDKNTNLCGGVASFNINSDLSLTYLNSLSFPGKPPCYISLDNINNNIFSGNYHENNIISYSLKSNGEIGRIISEIPHKYDSHVHYTELTPDKKYLCVVDLGQDEITLYNHSKGVLRNSLILKVRDGSGPRHIVFHPNGKFAYVICELSSKIITLSYDSTSGFEIINYTSTIPLCFNSTNSTAAIRISSDGNFLYGSNRGHDSIVAYSICKLTGALYLIDFYSTHGSSPRDFNLTPDNNFIVISNQLTNNLTVYRRTINTGTLELIQKDIIVPAPVCIQFL